MKPTFLAASAALIAAAALASAAAALDGSYESEGVTMAFGADGTVETTVPAFNVTFSSAYAVDGDTLTITSPDDDMFCPGAVGSYTVEESGDTVTFTLIEDSCQARADSVAAGVWTKQ